MILPLFRPKKTLAKVSEPSERLARLLQVSRSLRKGLQDSCKSLGAFGKACKALANVSEFSERLARLLQVSRSFQKGLQGSCKCLGAFGRACSLLLYGHSCFSLSFLFSCSLFSSYFCGVFRKRRRYWKEWKRISWGGCSCCSC